MRFLSFPIFYTIFVLSTAYAVEPTYPTVSESTLKGQVRTNLDSPKPTQGQLRRKEHFTKMVAALGVPTNESLPVTEDAKEIKPHGVDEVARRAIAVAVAAVKGEGMLHTEVVSLVKRWQIEDYFSPQELIFIKNPLPTQNDKIKFAWRYEGLEVLLWALGYNAQLPPPNVICDVKKDTKTIVGNRAALLAKNARPRSISEILDMADYYYRLHWGAIELRLKNKKNSAIDEEIIEERHRALNWLIRYMGAEWDDVTTDT